MTNVFWDEMMSVADKKMFVHQTSDLISITDLQQKKCLAPSNILLVD